MSDSEHRVRVLQVVAAPTAVADGELGLTGPERRAGNLIDLWSDVDVDVALAYPRRGRLWERFAASGRPLIDYEIAGKLDFGAIRRLAGMAKSVQAQVIHTQGPPSLDLFAVLAARACGASSVVTRPVMIEDNVHRAHIRRALYQAVDRWVTLPRANAVVAVSEDGRRRLRDLAPAAAERVQLVLNGVDVSRFRSERRKESGPVVLGMIGHLLPYKGWPDFLQVVSNLRRRGYDVQALVVGEGPQRAELESLAAHLGVSQYVEFVGYRADVAPLLASLDILLFTSHREGLSVAIIEAMAAGLPIVATAVGGIADQVTPGVNGFVSDAGDISGLTDACGRLIEDHELRRSMGAASRRTAEERFSQQAMLQAYAGIYRRIARPGQNTGPH